MPKRTKVIRSIRKLANQHGQRVTIVRQGSHEIWECAGLRFPFHGIARSLKVTARAIINRLTEHLEAVGKEA